MQKMLSQLGLTRFFLFKSCVDMVSLFFLWKLLCPFDTIHKHVFHLFQEK